VLIKVPRSAVATSIKAIMYTDTDIDDNTLSTLFKEIESNRVCCYIPNSCCLSCLKALEECLDPVTEVEWNKDFKTRVSFRRQMQMAKYKLQLSCNQPIKVSY
jgi:nicotinate-nucleotide pyrophosphorylase